MDSRAFEQAVLEHKDRVHGYAAMMLRDSAEAQDVAQEALVRLWTHRDEIETSLAGVWLLRTTRNLCIDRLRRRSVRAEVADGPDVLERQAGSAPDPERIAGSGEASRALLRALEDLSEADRTVIVMREVQGLPYDEIASTLGVPLGTLKARLHRARERLRTELVRVGVSP
jgi:RNA polymerase sigma-70 factor, ECF subfamily